MTQSKDSLLQDCTQAARSSARLVTESRGFATQTMTVFTSQLFIDFTSQRLLIADGERKTLTPSDSVNETIPLPAQLSRRECTSRNCEKIRIRKHMFVPSFTLH